jgi:glycosyltransferase involved in cell wall biosynthesis
LKLSIVVPVFNEEKTILDLLKRAERSVESLKELVDDYEFIIVDDGSNDQTGLLLRTYTKEKKSFKLFRHESNLGKGAALSLGFLKTTGDLVLIQDADLEYDPKDYKQLLVPFFHHQADVVFGSRFSGENGKVPYYHHYLGNRALTFLSNLLTNLNLSDIETCYKVFRGPFIRNMILHSKRFGVEPEITAKISKVPGLSLVEVPISYKGRTYKEGKKIGWKDGLSALWSIFKYNLFWSFKMSFKLEKKSLLSKGHDFVTPPR